MTITANPVRNQYTAAPNQTVFNYTYKIYSDNDLSVYVTPAGQAPDDSADLITSYTVDPGTIGNQSGGFITLDTGANSGDIITIASAIEYDRETDYQTNGDFSPETVNGDIDRVVSLVKQNKGLINRAVLAPASGGGEDEPISFPSPDDQKGLKWESGNLANTPIVESVTTDSTQYQLVSVSGNDVKIRGLKSGQNVTLTDDGTDILIKAEVQGGQGDVSSSSSNTYAPGTTQAFDAATANTMSVGGVDVTAKNVEQDEAIGDAASAASVADGKAVAAQSTADANALNILPKAETYYLNSTSAQRQITHSCSNDAASYTIEIFFNVNNDFSEETNKFVRVSTNGSEIRNLFIYDTSSSTVGATFTENFVRSAGTAFSLYFENDGDDKILSYTITLDKSSIEDTISVIYDTGLPSKVDSRELFTRFTPIA
jgi:hypothetical protein